MSNFRNYNMRKIIFLIFMILAGLFFFSCKNKSSKNNPIEVVKKIDNKEKTLIIANEVMTSEYAKQTIDDELAKQIRHYITSKFLRDDDLKGIMENKRKFQLYKIDLNDDGKNEVLVNFFTSYFCGTGGCTLLLLDNNLKMINKFTSTRTLFVEQTLQNNWRILMTESEGSWRKLIYLNGSYPSNPSMEEKTTEFPSGNAEILFDENYSNPKTYNF